ncbi:MAG: bifunctional diguanylate cyclase/phosphodiesterase [Lachnospiraceae bacterium]|nr:bifunctional diguanylate cyclase/phosphodiesterase [Lachnospiraceae bacterium]
MNNNNTTSEVTRLKEKLLHEREKMEIFLSLNSGCLFEYYPDDDVLVFSNNSLCAELDGKIFEQCCTDMPFQNILSNEDIERFCNLLQAEKNGAIEIQIKMDNGREEWCRVKVAVLSATENEKTEVVGSIVNIHDEHIAKEKEEEGKLLDPVTKLFNRYAVAGKIDEYFNGLGNNLEHTMFVIDIDGFSLINDHMGELFGDTVLTNISDELRYILRRGDIVGRIGDDEFVILLKDMTELEQLEQSARELDKALKTTYVGETDGASITCSIGAARYPKDGNCFGDLFAKCDSALYHAKSLGGGSLQLYSEDNGFPLKEDGDYYNYYSTKYETKEYYHLFDFGQEMTKYAFDLMSTTRDVSSAIQMLIEKIGKHYNATSVGVFEKLRMRSKLELSYVWSEKWIDVTNQRVKVDFSYAKELEAFTDKNNLYVIDNLADEPDTSPVRKLVKIHNNNALMLCTFYEEGRCKGCVYMADLKNARKWTEEEKSSFVVITQIISFYMLKLRVSERMRDNLEHMKNYDALTGIPTFYKFENDAKEYIRKNTGKYALIYSDISNFKYINETLGYQSGDRILYDYALMLKKYSDERCLFARVSADNFVMLRPVDDEEKMKDWVLKFNEEFRDSQRKKNIMNNLMIVSGINFFESGSGDISVIVDNANVARKAAKNDANSNIRIYDRKMEEKIHRESEITDKMEQALRNHEFVVYLQPKIELEDERLVGAEALIRWKKDDGTLMPPNDFIPLFEKNGFVLQLDFFVYEEVCKMLRKWIDEEKSVVPVSVNVSRVHLNDPTFIQKLCNLVESYNIPKKYIELELTESMFLDNTEEALSTMKKLRKLGFHVSIDDFGAGYSSLNLLKNMPTDVLKLDKEFFGHKKMKKEEEIIVTSIVEMAKRLNMKVLSEGIETEMQSEFLKKIGCDMAQGYFFFQPISVDKFEKLLDNQE